MTRGVAPKRRFELVPFEKIALATGRSYLVKGLVPREGLVVVWGPPKCGKTFWMYDVAMHVALGWPYRGRQVQQGPVVYIACEGERGLGARTEAYRQCRLAEDHGPVPFYLVTTRLDLAADAAALIADIRAPLGAETPVMVVVDTLNRSIGGSESSDEDMGAYVKAADTIREAFNCAVILIHHCGIDDRRPRGHTSLTGAADAQIAVKRDGDGLISTIVEYAKDGREGEETTSKLEVFGVGFDEDASPITSCVIVPADGEATPRQPKLKPQTKLALDLLHQAIAAGGQPAPASDRIPRAILGVTKLLWRECLAKGGVINEEGNPREQMRRLVVTLKSQGLIGIWDDFVWPVTERHKASQ
jgi:hypothetical protein